MPVSADNPPPLSKRRSCSHVGFWVAIVLLGVLLGLSVLLNAGLAAGLWAKTALGRGARAEEPEDEWPRFDERWSYGNGETKAVRIAVEGVLERSVREGLLGLTSDPTGEIIRQIRAARNDAAVRVLMVEVDSPGGELAPTDEIHRALREFRESRDDRRVVVFVRGLAASGGYYIAAAADRIVVEPTALLGSISVLIQTLNWHVLSERVGVTDTTIRSGRHKDLLNPFRPPEPEEIELLQRIVDDAHARFVQLVAEGRGLTKSNVAEAADGRIFTASDAVAKKLADRLGYWEDALKEAEELAGKSLQVVRYERPLRFSDWLMRLSAPVRLALPRAVHRPRLMCLWQP